MTRLSSDQLTGSRKCSGIFIYPRLIADDQHLEWIIVIKPRGRIISCEMEWGYGNVGDMDLLCFFIQMLETVQGVGISWLILSPAGFVMNDSMVVSLQPPMPWWYNMFSWVVSTTIQWSRASHAVFMCTLTFLGEAMFFSQRPTPWMVARLQVRWNSFLLPSSLGAAVAWRPWRPIPAPCPKGANPPCRPGVRGAWKNGMRLVDLSMMVNNMLKQQ